MCLLNPPRTTQTTRTGTVKKVMKIETIVAAIVRMESIPVKEIYELSGQA